MALVPRIHPSLLFFLPPSSCNLNSRCHSSAKGNPKPLHTSHILISLSRGSLQRQPGSRIVKTPLLLGRILAYLNRDDETKEAKLAKIKRTAIKTKESLELRIEQETRSKRIGDRDSTPTVRALTWALRGAQDEAKVDAILGESEISISIFTSVIQKLGMGGNPEAAVALFRWLQQRDESSEKPGRPNVYTYNSLLGALKANRCYDLGAVILEDMRENGITSDIVTCNTVISMYDQQGRYDEALKVFDDLKPLGILPDLFTYRNLIQILARSGQCQRALEIFRELKQQESTGIEGLEKGRPELKREKAQREELDNFLVQMCCRRLWSWLGSDFSTIPEVGSLFEKMRVAEVTLNAKMCKDLIRACGQREQDHYLVKSLYLSMRNQEFPLTVSLCNHVIRVLGRGKKWWAALEVYESMMSIGPSPNETTQRILLSHFQILLNSARKRRLWKWALQLLDKMKEKGIEPDAFAWNAALIACGRANETASAVQVFQRMIESGQKPGVLSYGALLSALEKGNLLDKAEEVWTHMQRVGIMPNEYAYTTMISVYGKAGNNGMAIALMDEMRATGMEPTVVTYNAIITACARAGDGQRALDWLQQMKAAWVKPDSITYAQVIEALANEGQWKPAVSMYVKMLELKLAPPCAAYDAVLRVCTANDAPVDHELIGPRPGIFKDRYQGQRFLDKRLIVANNLDTSVSATNESVSHSCILP